MINLPKLLHLSRILALAVILSGCFGSGSSSDGSGSPPDGPPPPPANRAPTISGSPITNVAIDELYDFQPTASDPDGDELTFSIQNRPGWASFEAETGRLYGSPGAGDVGQFSGIIVSVSDGNSSDSLGAFEVAVNQVSLGSVTVAWTPPTTNEDGTAIADLAGYRIYYGRSPNELDEVVVVDNPGTIRRVIDNLSPATWYFSMTSYDSAGLESVRTPVGSTTLT